MLGFLDDLGGGDLQGAAARLGPGSEAYLQATAGSVEAFLQVAAEGFGAWAAAPDRATNLVEVRAGDVVVVVSGTLLVEGNVEERYDAFPARYAESAGVWFVEPWAMNPGDDRLELLVNDTADRVDLIASAAGEAWLSIDYAPPIQVVVAEDGVAAWDMRDALDGEHTLVAAFINEGNFTAVAAHSPCGEPGRFCTAAPVTTSA